MLQLIKDFAKRHLGSRESDLPEEVAKALYYLAIAAALIRCRARLTSVADTELRRGFDWAVQQPWLDETSRELITEARKAVGEG